MASPTSYHSQSFNMLIIRAAVGRLKICPYNGAIETIQNTQNAVGGSEDTFQITFSLLPGSRETQNLMSNVGSWLLSI